MRFLSLLLLSGCALVDAAGDPHGTVASGLSFDPGNVGIGGTMPRDARILEIDGTDLGDVAVVGMGGELFRCLGRQVGALMFDCAPAMNGATPLTGYSKLATGDLGEGPQLVAIGNGKLHVLGPGEPSFNLLDLSAKLPATTNAVSDIVIGNLAVGPSIVIAFETDNNLTVIVDPLHAATVMSIPFMTQGSPRIDLAVGNTQTNDGFEELITVNGTDTITQFSGPSLTPTTISNGGSIEQISVHPFTNGPANDVAYIRHTQNTGEILLGSPTGLSAQAVMIFAEQIIENDIGGADLDGDGKIDLVVLARAQGNQTAHLAVFTDIQMVQQPIEIDVPLDNPAQRFDLGDLNHDGKADLLLLPPQGGGVDFLVSQ